MAFPFEDDDKYELKTQYIGVGEYGKKIGVQLNKRCQVELGGKKIKSSNFNFTTDKIAEIPSSTTMVFLAGLQTDKNFWLARKMIFSQGVYLLFTISLSTDNKIELLKDINTQAESLIYINQNDFFESAVNTIIGIYSMIMMPGMVCFDASDLKSTVAGTWGKVIHSKSTYAESLKHFTQSTKENGNFISNSDILLLNILYDKKVDITLDDMTAIVEALNDGCLEYKKEDFLVWTCTDSLNLNPEFRSTLLLLNYDKTL